MMQKGTLNYQNATVSYLRFGKGKKLLIAFHGFRDQAAVFEPLVVALSKEYTCYALDLPYHGETVWDKAVFTADDLAALVLMFAKQEGKEKFDLMGYSFGGRAVLCLLETFKKEIQKIYLIAPDGLNTKWMSSVTITPLWLQGLLKRWLEHPRIFFAVLKRLYDFKIISKFVYKFAQYNLRNEENRTRTFSYWSSLQYFKTKPKAIKSYLEVSALPVELYYGKKDKVIRPYSGEWLSKGLSSVRLNLLDEGHLLIKKPLNQLLEDQFNEVH